MGFMIKSAFWLSLVLLLIPFGVQGQEGERNVGALETLMAARAVIGDVAGLCERRPDTCEVGKAAFNTIGIRAKEGARIAYGLLDEHFGETGEQPLHTGSVPTPEKPVEAPRQ